jgi:hypothetical protein
MPNPWYNKLVDMLTPPVLRVVCTTPYGISMSTLFQPPGTLPPDEPKLDSCIVVWVT